MDIEEISWWRYDGEYVTYLHSNSVHTLNIYDLDSIVFLCVDYSWDYGWDYVCSDDEAEVYNDGPDVPWSFGPANGATFAAGPGGTASVMFEAEYGHLNGIWGHVGWYLYKCETTCTPVVGSPSHESEVVYGNEQEPVSWSPDLEPGYYKWWIQGYDVEGWVGPWSDYSDFTVVPGPPVPTRVSPADERDPPLQTARPVLRATATGSSPLSYGFELALDSSSNCSGTTVIGEFTFPTGNFTVPSSWSHASVTQWLKDGRNYCWRAQTIAQIAGVGEVESGYGAWWKFSVRVPRLGTGGNWPMWGSGPLSVNETNGNLVLALPAPAFPTAAGALTAAITYNSLDSTTLTNGLGEGWTVGPTLDAPRRLVDHNVTEGQDTIELVYPDGASIYYQHIPESSVYHPPGGSLAQLTANPDGTFTLLDDGGSVYSFGTASSGIAYLTNAQSLASNANVGRLNYTFHSGTGRLRQVDAIGDGAAIEDATLHLYWHDLDSSECPDAILCIVGPDGVSWEYVGTSGTSGKVQYVNNGTRDVLKLDYYGTGDTTRPRYLRNANDLQSGATHKVELVYCETSCATGVAAKAVKSITSGPISGQSPSSSTTSFVYHPDQSGSTLTAASRADHSSFGSTGSGVQRPADGYTEIKPPCQQGSGTCPGRSGTATIKVYYDSLGQPMQTTGLLGVANSDYTQTHYDEKGQLLWGEDEDGNATDYVYDPVDNTLTSVTAPNAGAGRPVTRYFYDETAYGSVSGGVYTPGSALRGVQAYYFKNNALTSPSSGGRADAVETNVTGAMDTFAFSWGASAPPALTGYSGNYSVRFAGNLNLSASSGDFQFKTFAQGGTRLTVDGQLLIDNWDGQHPEAPLPITLPAGKHKFVLEIKDATGSSSTLSLQYKCTASCTGLPTSYEAIPASKLAPAWGNQTATVSPLGKVAFSHFDRPWAGLPDYTLAKAPVNGATEDLITYFEYDAYGRTTGKVMPNGNTGATLTDGALSDPGNPAASNYGTVYSYYGNADVEDTPDTSDSGAALHSSCSDGDVDVAQLGLLREVAQHGLHPVTTVYDASGRPVEVTNAAGAALSCYDAEGRVKATKAPGDTYATVNEFDPAGNLVSTGHGGADVSTEGTVATEYDEAGRPVKITDAHGAVQELSYDAGGNLLARVDQPDAAAFGEPPELAVGTVLPYAGSAGSVPSGWLLADGSTLSRSTYADLFAAIGTAYGAPDGSTFKTPDLRGRFPIGKSASGPTSTLGATGGSLGHGAENVNLPSHTHAFEVASHTHSVNGVAAHSHTWTGSVKSDGLAEWAYESPRPGTGTLASSCGNACSNGWTTTSSAGAQTVTSGAATATASVSAADPPFQAVNYIVKATEAATQQPCGAVYWIADGAPPETVVPADGGSASGALASCLDGAFSGNRPSLAGRLALGKATSGTGSTLAGTGGQLGHTHTATIGTHSHSASMSGHTHTIQAPSSTHTVGYDNVGWSDMRYDPFEWITTEVAGTSGSASNGGTTLTSDSVGGSATVSTTSDPVTTSAADPPYLVLEPVAYETAGYTLEVGMVVPFAGGAVPEGWALADGSCVSQAANERLFSEIGQAFSQPACSSGEFRLPDLRARMPLGRTAAGPTATIGATGGQLGHTHAIPGHRPTLTPPAHGHSWTLPAHTHTIAETATGFAGSNEYAPTQVPNLYSSSTFSSSSAGADTIGSQNQSAQNVLANQPGSGDNVSTSAADPAYLTLNFLISLNGGSPPTYTTSYSYDNADRLTGKTAPDTSSYSFFYDARGNLRGTQYPNGTSSWAEINSLGQLTALYNRDGAISGGPPTDTSPIADYTYTYTADGQKSQEQWTMNTTTVTVDYSYDTIGRLERITRASNDCTEYWYDRDSNRTQIRTSSASGCSSFTTQATYSYSTGTYKPVDALTAIGGTSYGYDGGGSTLGDGNLVSRGTDSFTWDGHGRLHTATVAGNSACYRYDPTGALLTRTHKTSAANCTSPTSTTNYLLGGDYETNGDDELTRSYVDGPAGNLASYAGAPTGSPTFLYYNGHGDTAAEASSGGTVTATFTYDPWGVPATAPTDHKTSHRYTGRWDKKYDATTALILMGARPYDPEIGRFLAVDPIDGGSLNNYDYAAQDPINKYDLEGLEVIDDYHYRESGTVNLPWRNVPGPGSGVTPIRVDAYVSLNGRQLRVDFKTSASGMQLAGIGIICLPSCDPKQIGGYARGRLPRKFNILLPNREGTYQVALKPAYRAPNTIRSGKLIVPLGKITCNRDRDSLLICRY